MNRGSLALLFCVVAAFSSYSDELPVDGCFTQQKEDNQPVQWQLHTWDGYKPFAKMEIQKNGDAGKNILTIRDIKSERGSGVITAERFPARSGDGVRVSFRARGKGKGKFNLHCYTKNGGWNHASDSYVFQLTPQWTQHTHSFTITDGPNGETGKFAICFVAAKDGELDLSSIQAEYIPSEYRGSLALPRQWTVFGPLSREFIPSDAELNSIPKMLDGVAGQPLNRADQRIDFLPVLGPGKGKCAWAFAAVQASAEMDCTIGAGADWWMQLFVNGKIVFDTMEDGNAKSPITISNHMKTIRLKKGENIIAAKLISGSASASLYVGGPDDLRAAEQSGKQVKLVKIDWTEDFEGKKVSCSGNPTVIQGYPTPGLLILTGQGVFRTDSRLTIAPPQTEIAMPKDDSKYAAFGLRIQNFGTDKRADGDLAMSFSASDRIYEMIVGHKAAEDQLTLHFMVDGKEESSQTIPYQVLPADFLFSANRKGHYCLTVNSLADSSFRSFFGDSTFFFGLDQMKAKLELRAADGKPAEITVDDLMIGQSADDTGELPVPFKIERNRTFDPVKAGWKLMFSDEFDGTELDLKKWFYSSTSRKDLLAVRDGKLIISADWNEQKTAVQSARIYTHQDFLYGYFEARLKFRKEPGWWAAFWLCSTGPSNAFIDGMEIDIFEDYYLRPKTPGGKPGNTLDHNLHMYASNKLKSWNYNSKLPGSIEDFYVIGCKWTPFEISYYMNGKLISSTANHSPYDSVTFDAFHHGMGATPLKGILSGCCGRSGGDPKLGHYPEHFEVDYVRFYEYPRSSSDTPEIQLTVKGAENYRIPHGTALKFQAEVKPSEKSNSPISCVYLMDSGFLLDYKTEPPFDFEIRSTPEFYRLTQYAKPGRSGEALEFYSIHAFSVVAQDAKGNVAFTRPLVRFFAPPYIPSRPYQGKPQVLPGRLNLPFYDEGGQNVAYADSTPKNLTDRTGTFRPGEAVDATEKGIGYIAGGEWINYTVEVRKSGRYQAKLQYGTPVSNPHGIMLLVDGIDAGEFKLLPHDPKFGYSADSYAEIDGIELSKGKHVLTLLFCRSAVNLSHIDFQLK